VLFRRAVTAAVTLWREVPPRTEDSDLLSSLLPPELRRVLSLSLDLRHCFVLRMLVGLSPQECSRLLHLDSRRVDEVAGAAAKELARIGQNEAQLSTESRSTVAA
jgi:DNA-directed RNA polymerase specialized sigma24 family protein